MFPSKKLMNDVLKMHHSSLNYENSILKEEILKVKKHNPNIITKIDKFEINFKNFILKQIFFLKQKNKEIQLKKFLDEIESLKTNKINFKKKKINIFLNYEIFKSEINQIYHPDTKIINSKRFNSYNKEYLKLLKNTFLFLEKNSSKFLLFFLDTVSNLVPLIFFKKNRNKNISFTMSNLQSTIFFSGENLILLSESIIHESTHNFIYMMEKFNKLYKNEKHKINTPLRKDKRPIKGFFHQFLVLYNLKFYYQNLLNNKHNQLVIKNKNSIIKRQKMMEKDFNKCLNIFSKNKKFFTNYAKQLLTKNQII